jgi:hypothetical protein
MQKVLRLLKPRMMAAALVALCVYMLPGAALAQTPPDSPPADWGPVSINLEEIAYPYPVHFLHRNLYGQDVRIAYMDAAPTADANGRTVILLHGSSYYSWYWEDTMQALTAAGRTNHDYATHLPHYVERDKLVELFERYDLHNQTLLWEVLYGNTYRDSPTRARPFFARVGKPMESEQLGVVTRRATVLNHTAYGWCEGIRSFLAALMPDMASVEINTEAHPTIRPAKRSRIVKRRPVETHRGYVGAQQ